MHHSSADDKNRVWTQLIDEFCADQWLHPETSQPVISDFKRIDIAEGLVQQAAQLVDEVLPAQHYAVVCDENTFAAAGERIAAQLGSKSTTIILPSPHADISTINELRKRSSSADALIAVGSGTINDLCKYASLQDKRSYCAFGTAASMNGYSSTTASITLDSGMKATLPAQSAKGVFLDLNVCADAPPYLTAAGFADSLCRSTAQVDWYLSHCLLGTSYTDLPFQLQVKDEAALLSQASDVGHGSLPAIGTLHRLLTLGGFGITLTGSSHPGSMGEHQISHWIDNFAGDAHPGSIHGQQVGLAILSMAKLHAQILQSSSAPVVKPSQIDERALRDRYPSAAIDGCLAAVRDKALDQEAAARMNDRLAECWPSLRRELLTMHIPPTTLETYLVDAGACIHPDELGLDPHVYRQAVRYAHEIRDRYSMLDLASDMGILDAFADDCC